MRRLIGVISAVLNLIIMMCRECLGLRTRNWVRATGPVTSAVLVIINFEDLTCNVRRQPNCAPTSLHRTDRAADFQLLGPPA